MAVFLPLIGIAARMAATRAAPHIARAGARTVGSKFPQLGAAATRFVGNPARAVTARMQQPVMQRFAGATGVKKALNPLSWKASTLALTPEWMAYDAFANSQMGQNLQNRIRSWGQRNAPATTQAIEGMEDWLYDKGIFDEDNDRRPGAGGGAGGETTGGGAPLGSADYSAYENSLRDAGQAASVNISAMNAQYDRIIEELKGQYQLAETEEEKERIRYIVADVEAQREAGQKAIGEIYAAKVQEIQQTAATSRQQTGLAAQQAGDVFRRGAEDLQRDVAGSREGLLEGSRGLGIGTGFESGAAPWHGLMSTMAPVAQNYAQRIGDIGADAIDFIGATTRGQEGAQQADLQRLAMATSSTARMEHASEVANRIANERLALNQQIAALRSQQMSEQASGRELNARLADAAAERRDAQAGGLTPRMEALVEARSWGEESPELSYEDFAEWHERKYGVPPGEDMRAAWAAGRAARDD